MILIDGDRYEISQKISPDFTETKNRLRPVFEQRMPIMKLRILACMAAAFIMMSSAPAFASSCPKHMKAIDAALKTTHLDKAKLAEVKHLRMEGEAMHKAGKHDESMKSLSAAEAILGIH